MNDFMKENVNQAAQGIMDILVHRCVKEFVNCLPDPDEFKSLLNMCRIPPKMMDIVAYFIQEGVDKELSGGLERLPNFDTLKSLLKNLIFRRVLELGIASLVEIEYQKHASGQMDSLSKDTFNRLTAHMELNQAQPSDQEGPTRGKK